MSDANKVVTLSRRDAVRIAAVVGCDPRSVHSRAQGRRQSPPIAEAIDRAATQLGITIHSTRSVPIEERIAV